MTFSLHQGGVVMSSQITHTHNHQDTPLSPYTWLLILDFQYLRPFYSLSQLHHLTASLPSPCANHQSTEGRSERTQCQAKISAWNSFSYICTRALHSFRSFAHCRAASTVFSLLPKVTFTPSIQPNLGLPRTRPPLPSAINTLLDIWYSSILSKCPNHLNTLWSALLANSLSIPALLRTSSFQTLSFATLQQNFSNTSFQEHSLSFSQRFSYPMPLLRTTPLVLLLRTLFSAPQALYPSFILCTTSFSHPPSAATCDPRYLKQSTSSKSSPFSITCIRSPLPYLEQQFIYLLPGLLSRAVRAGTCSKTRPSVGPSCYASFRITSLLRIHQPPRSPSGKQQIILNTGFKQLVYLLCGGDCWLVHRWIHKTQVLVWFVWRNQLLSF